MNVNELLEGPCYVFTSDVDWAPESMIEGCLEAHRDVPLTMFATHPSEALRHRRHVGVHPNFRSGSTQGSSPAEVIQYVKTLSDGDFYRCHGFYEDTNISVQLKNSGYVFDSNLALHLQDYVIPLRHQSGTTRYPVTLEDDYLLRETGLNWEKIRAHLDAPGLKIFNFHPIHITLNTPSLDYYEAHRGNPERYSGEGAATTLDKIIDYVEDNPGLGAHYLDDLHRNLSEPYSDLAADERVHAVKTRYDELDNADPYATSRDHNLRELEIDFILANIKPGAKILDLGCGNGYTDIRMALNMDVDVTGLDISPNMIAGAHKLEQQFSPLRGSVFFAITDCRTIPYPDNQLDTVITERFLLNLPDGETQRRVIAEIHRVLKPGGTYIMVEGSLDGLEALNELRERVGLKPIPNRSGDNVSAIKFRESELEQWLAPMFNIQGKTHWGNYYLISRVVHPLMTAPEEPRFNSPINGIARRIEEANRSRISQFGHVVGYVLTKRRQSK